MFMTPLRNDNIVEKADITKIFSNIETLVQINKHLAQDLETAATNNPVNLLSCIGDSFMNMVSLLLFGI
jgi:hypothetical protein